MPQLTQNRAELILAARAMAQLWGAHNHYNDITHVTLTREQCTYLLAALKDDKYRHAAKEYMSLFDDYGTPTDTEAEKLLDEASRMVYVTH
jgi:hypothetical protein